MISFDWTINVSQLLAVGGFLTGLGIFMGKITAFMKESAADRKGIWKRIDWLTAQQGEFHKENQVLLKSILAKGKFL